MKKLIVLICFLLTAATLSSCGNDGEYQANYDKGYNEGYNQALDDVDSTIQKTMSEILVDTENDYGYADSKAIIESVSVMIDDMYKSVY